MQHRRRIRLLRRFVLGLAVAAIVAPAAQASIPDSDRSVLRGAEVRAADESDGVVLRRSRPAAIPQGEHKTDLPQAGPAVLVQGEHKADLPQAGPAVLVHGEHKADLPRGLYVPFASDFPRTAPAPSGDGTLAGYRRALPQDYGVVRVEVPSGPSFDWGDAFIGAGGALALLLLAGGATLATRHIGRPAAA
jgi:hypothetical protein